MIINLFKVLLISSLFQFNLTAQDEYSISGNVSDALGEPLPGVEVFVEELSTGTTTDREGKFTLSGLRKGNYTLRFSYISYADVTREVVVPSTEAVSVILEMAAVNLDEVIVTGNPFLSDLREISQTTISLGKIELMNQSNHSVAEALNYQPGIAMRSNGIATGRPVIRGFSDNKVLILEDGLRMGDLSNSSDDHGLSDDGSQPDKIEVLQGPSSLLYGSGAIGGVVNIITDAIPTSVQNGLHGEVLAQGSTVNSELLGNAHLNYGTGMLALHAKVFKRKGENYTIPDGSKTPGSDLDSYGSQFGISIHPSWGLAGITYSGFNNEYGLPVDPAEDEEAYIDMRKNQYRFAADIFKINSILTSMSLKGAYIDYNHKEISREDNAVGSEFGMVTQTADISFTHKPFSEITNGIIGFYTLLQEYKVTGEEALTPNSDNNALAVYFYEKLKLPGVILSFGARYEFNEIEIPETILSDSTFAADRKSYKSLSASLGITFDFIENTSLFINLANAFRAPAVEELSAYGIHKATSGFEMGNRLLDEEKTIGIDAGIRSRSQYYYFEISGFYNRVNNLIYKQPVPLFYNEEEDGFNDSGEGYRVYQYQQSKAAVYGFQGVVNYELFKSYNASIITDYIKAENLSIDENIAMIPPFRFSLEFRYNSQLFWYGARLNLTASQNDVAPEEEPTKGFGIVSLYGGVKTWTGEFAHMIDLKINNLLNQPYKDHLSAIKNFTYMPGRNLTLSYRFLF